MPKKPILLLLTLLSWMAVTAQSGVDVPYIIFADGSLFVSRGVDAQPFDACTPDERISTIHNVSPDGRYFTIETTPEFVTDAIERVGGVGGGPIPSNLWLCGQALGGSPLVQFAGQPLNASFLDDTQPDVGNSYAAPVWSPDGTRIASVEMRYDDGAISESLYIYDIASGLATNVALNLPPQFGVPSPSPVYWIGETLVVQSVEANADVPGGLVNALLTYDAQGTGLLRLELAQVEANAIIQTAFPVTDAQAGTLMGLIWSNGDFLLLNPTDGVVFRADGAPELYNPLAADDVSLVWRGANPDGNGLWDVHQNGAVALDNQDGRIVVPTVTGIPNTTRIAIRADEPTSTAIIAVSDSGIDIIDIDLGRFIPVEGVTATSNTVVLAGPQAWRVKPTDSQSPPPDSSTEQAVTEATPTTQPVVTGGECPQGVPPRLVVGESGLVVDALPNRVRAEPSLQGRMVGEITPGNIFTVLDGPVCADGYAWWQVEFGSITGWTAEGEGTTYWLAPLG